MAFAEGRDGLGLLSSRSSLDSRMGRKKKKKKKVRQRIHTMSLTIWTPPLRRSAWDDIHVRWSAESLVVIASVYMVVDAVVRPLLYPHPRLTPWTRVRDFLQCCLTILAGDTVYGFMLAPSLRCRCFPLNVTKVMNTAKRREVFQLRR